MNNCPNPLATHLPLYQEAGWEVLPLPYGLKKTPPVGTTGLAGIGLTEDDLFEFAQKPRNIAVRLAEDMIGIDVDARHDGFKTFFALEEKLGELPKGWFGFTSSPDPMFDGFTMFFRVPKGWRFHDGAGQGIDVIQKSYRYSVAPGSVLEDGRTYRLINDYAFEMPIEMLPSPEEAPELPEAWFDFLKKEELVTSFREAAENAVVLSPTEGTCAYMEAILARRLGMLRNRKESRHSMLRDASWAMVKEAGKGHKGAEAALEVYLKAWHASFSAVEKDLPRGKGLHQEAKKLIENAKATTAAPTASCTCGTRTAPELTDWDKKWLMELTPAQRIAARNPQQVLRNLEGKIMDPFEEKTDEEIAEIAAERKRVKTAEEVEQERQEALEAISKKQEATRARNAAKAATRAQVVAEAEKAERERAEAENRAPKKVRAGVYGPSADDLAVVTTTFARRSPEEMAKARAKAKPRPRSSNSYSSTTNSLSFTSHFGR